MREIFKNQFLNAFSHLLDVNNVAIVSLIYNANLSFLRERAKCIDNFVRVKCDGSDGASC